MAPEGHLFTKLCQEEVRDSISGSVLVMEEVLVALGTFSFKGVGTGGAKLPLKVLLPLRRACIL